MDDDEKAEFSTARELRDEADSTAASVSFDVDNPERTHSRGGGMCYEGGTVLALAPARPEGLAEAVEAVLQAGPYRYGDWFDLPMPLFLVHDDETDDTFRVAVRDGRVELHARSATTASGLRAFYERLADQVEGRVRVEREEQAT